MVHLDLFAGIGGFSLAADWVWEDVEHIFCEIEPYAQKVLKKHWPNGVLHNDITKLDGTAIDNVFLLSGGFPCQPYSVSGKQRGAEDDRALWPEMLRVIQETKPRWIIGENVGGFVSMGLDSCIADLEGAGYDCQPLVIPSCAVDTKHRRDRVWILAHSDSKRCRDTQERQEKVRQSSCGGEQVERWRGNKDVANTTGFGQQGQGELVEPLHPEAFKEWQANYAESVGQHGKWCVEPRVGRVANGIPARVDRLKGLGNAIVPQVAAIIMQAIKDIEDGYS